MPINTEVENSVEPDQGPVVQSVVSLMSSLSLISLTVLVDSIHCKSYSHFFNKKFQHICISLNVNFNESLTNDVVSFEQLLMPSSGIYELGLHVHCLLRPVWHNT